MGREKDGKKLLMMGFNSGLYPYSTKEKYRKTSNKVLLDEEILAAIIAFGKSFGSHN